MVNDNYYLHKHNYIEVSVIMKGRVSHELNGVFDILERGDIVILSPSDMHRLVAIEPILIYKLCIYSKEADRLLANMINWSELPLRGRADEETLNVIETHFTNMLNALERCDGFSTQELVAHSILFLSTLLGVSKSDKRVANLPGYSLVTQAMDYVMLHYDERISLESVAEAMYINQSYLSKLFPKISGTTFKNFLTAQRVKHAKKLLESTDKSIIDIANESGFGSFTSFSRSFKNLTGRTPSDYRKETRIQLQKELLI